MFQTQAGGSSGQGSKKQRSAREEDIGQLCRDCVCLTYWGRNGSAELQECNTGMVWWSLATTSAPGSSSVLAAGLTDWNENTWEGVVEEVAPIPYSWSVCIILMVEAKTSVAHWCGKKRGVFPSLLGSSVIFLFTYDHQNAVWNCFEGLRVMKQCKLISSSLAYV